MLIKSRHQNEKMKFNNETELIEFVVSEMKSDQQYVKFNANTWGEIMGEYRKLSEQHVKAIKQRDKMIEELNETNETGSLYLVEKISKLVFGRKLQKNSIWSNTLVFGRTL